MSSDTPKSLRQAENRFHIRFNKAFPVVVASELFGDTQAVARNISAGGMFLEMADPLPLGSVITVHFPSAGAGEVRARGEVKHHYCFNYQGSDGEPALARGIGLRFLEFSGRSEYPDYVLPPVRDALH